MWPMQAWVSSGVRGWQLVLSSMNIGTLLCARSALPSLLACPRSHESHDHHDHAHASHRCVVMWVPVDSCPPSYHAGQLGLDTWHPVQLTCHAATCYAPHLASFHPTHRRSRPASNLPVCMRSHDHEHDHDCSGANCTHESHSHAHGMHQKHDDKVGSRAGDRSLVALFLSRLSGVW